MKLFPYGEAKRLLVTPIKEKNIDDSDPILKLLTAIRKIGTVTYTCDQSSFNVGDIVEYPFPQEDNGYLIEYDGAEYDLIPEEVVSTQNEEPLKFVFVEPLSKLETTETGIIRPVDSKGYTQKGKVIASPKGSIFEIGSTIEYRKHNQLFPQTRYKGVVCDTIYQHDIFKYRGHVAPHRIIVRFNRADQQKKLNRLSTGIFIPESFRYMLYHLQVGEVTEIGTEAAKLWPEISVGSMLIVHHTVESDNQNHRSVGADKEYNYRILNSFSRESTDKEIMGILKIGTLGEHKITPLNDWIFLDSEIELFEKTPSEMEVPSRMHKARKLTDLIPAIEENVSLAVKPYEETQRRLNYDRMRVVGEIKNGIEEAKNTALVQQIDAEMSQLNQHQLLIMSVYKRNMLLKAKQLFPKRDETILVPYQGLYPLNIMGKEYIIALKNFIVGTLKKS